PHKNRPTYKNNFLLLYLAFPGSAGGTPATALADFASASNAADFPLILSFIAKATTDAKARSKHHPIRLTEDPLAEWKKWQALKPEQQVKPDDYVVIDWQLDLAGF